MFSYEAIERSWPFSMTRLNTFSPLPRLAGKASENAG